MTHANSHTFQLDVATERLISSYLPLTPEEEQHLAQNGSDESRDKLVESNLRLVKSIVLKFSGCGFEASDLFMAGVTGPVKAVAHYVPSQGRLATFARHHIRGEILDSINTSRTSFHVPNPLRRQVNQYRDARQKLGDDARNPSYIFTASRTGYRFAEPGAARAGAAEARGDAEETA